MMLNYKLFSGSIALIATGIGLCQETPSGSPQSSDGNGAPVAEAPVVEEPATGTVPVGEAPVLPVPPPVNPTVDIAICLDTSGSMNGLIDAARQKLWAIVNEFVFAEPIPKLRVALLTYGNDGHNSENGWVKLETGLTEDLDLVSKILFEQTTNGGSEFVGRVVSAATKQLKWSGEAGALKLIVVAGNESADQDMVVRFADASKAAISTDIMVNAIYCGPLTNPDAMGWQQVARLADGQFAAIDHNNGTVVAQTPFDAELSTLSSKLNETYLPYGERGSWFGSNQVLQDGNASGLNSEASASRAVCKANQLYNCASWDLVDAIRQPSFVLADVELKHLPEIMQPMTAAQRVAYIERKGKERAKIQEKVNGIAGKRQKFIEAEIVRQGLDDSGSFDRAFIEALRSQACAKGYQFKEPKAAQGPEEPGSVTPPEAPAQLELIEKGK